MTKPRKVTREIADCIYNSYEALRLNGIKPYKALEIVQSDVLDEFGVEISLGTTGLYSNRTFDSVKETKRRYEERKKLGLIGPEREAPESNKVLSFIKGKPATYEEISRGTGKSEMQICKCVNFLRRKGKARSVDIALSRSGVKRIFHSEQLIDGLTQKTIVYCPGDEKRLGEEIIKYLPKEFSMKMRKSLTPKLKSVLPQETFEVVYRYMNEHKQVYREV